MTFCHYHRGPSETAVAVDVVEVGSGPGKFLFACKPCREQRRLTPLNPEHRDPEPQAEPRP